ncbi:hypothetical protein ABS735_18515 [Streptomyces sp. MMCC 100]|uniref:hypothetical protein n=1 Tax=Streptomyces sp. MMCC 100 TaxID=3163555 RepID=UPI003596D888
MSDPVIDVGALTALDVHTHAEISRTGHGARSPELFGASATYFKAHGHRQPTIDEMTGYYRERRMAAVVFTVDAEHHRPSADRRRGGRGAPGPLSRFLASAGRAPTGARPVLRRW